MLRRYEKVVIAMDVMANTVELIKKLNVDPELVKWYTDEQKKYIRKCLREIDRDFPDPLAKSIREGWRSIYEDKFGESGTDFRIMPVEDGDDWTDEEIEEYIMDEVGCPPINSPYDCTGKKFTWYVDFKRTPAGIVMIHSWSVDV